MLENILSAVKRLLANNFFEKISMNDIANEVGVSRQTVYRYAGNKANIRKLLQKQGTKIGSDTRSILLSTAIRIFARYGYNETSLELIAKESGFTKGAIYGIFQNKADLFISLLEQKLEYQFSYVPKEISRVFKEEDPIKSLTKFFEKQFAYAQSDPNWLRLFLEFATNNRDKEVQKRLNDAYDLLQIKMTDLYKQLQMEGYLDEEIEPQALAVIGSSIMDGIVMAWLLYPKHVNIPQLSNQLATILWRGLKP